MTLRGELQFIGKVESQLHLMESDELRDSLRRVIKGYREVLNQAMIVGLGMGEGQE